MAVLHDLGLSRESIPHSGQRVLLRRNANLRTGGTAIDITAEVHPEFATRAVEAAQVAGLEIAGIDIVAIDHRQPLDGKNGAILRSMPLQDCGCIWILPAVSHSRSATPLWLCYTWPDKQGEFLSWRS